MAGRVGILMVNLGSPDAPTSSSVRRYLAEFLHDPRVIDTSRWIWCPILHGVILRVRPARSARAYASIWDQPDGLSDEADQSGEAPLIRITRKQVEAVQKHLGEGVYVETAMRYGNPSIASALDRLTEKGCTHIGVLPLYPQFAGATTASVYDGVAKALKARMNVPELRFIRDYYAESDYIAALGKSVKTHLKSLSWKPDVILTSYHGLPQSYADKGDPYPQECQVTTDLLREYLELSDAEMRLTFQSRFGPKAWLQPYTDKTLEALPQQGVKNVCVMTPGFAADCLETLEEIAIEARETFIKAGGANFSFIPCLNADLAHTRLLAQLIKTRLLKGWA